MNRFLTTTALSVLLLVCCPGCAWFSAQQESAPSAIELYDLEGQHHKLSDHHGKVVIAVFWSSWCVMCKSVFPSLEKLQEEIGSDKLTVITIGVDDSLEKLKEAARAAQVPFPVLIDASGTVKRRFSISTIPTGIVFDTTGKTALIPDPDSGVLVKRVEGPKWWYKDSVVNSIRGLLAKSA